jgi:hypothetical protein
MMEVKYNEGLLQGIIARHVTKKLKCPYYFVNLYAFYNGTNELDFVYFDEYGYSIEVEVKSALNDFRDDFRLKIEKHKLLEEKDKSCPNRFYFAAPAGVIPLEEVPKHCGVLEIVVDSKGDFKIRVVKRASLIHNEKTHDHKDLFDKVYYQLTKLQGVWFEAKFKKFRSDLVESGLYNPSAVVGKAKKNPRKVSSSRRTTTRRGVGKRRTVGKRK